MTMNFNGSAIAEPVGGNICDDENFMPGGAGENRVNDDDIRKFTQNILNNSGNHSAVITKDGKVVPKNAALDAGQKDFTELYKNRVWG